MKKTRRRVTKTRQRVKTQGDGLKRKDFSGLEKQGSQQMLPKQGLRVEKKGRVKKTTSEGEKKGSPKTNRARYHTRNRDGVTPLCFSSRLFAPAVLVRRCPCTWPPPLCQRNAVVAGASSSRAGHYRAGKRETSGASRNPASRSAGIGIGPIKVAEARRRQTSQALGKGGGGSYRSQSTLVLWPGRVSRKSAASVLQRPPASTPRTTRRQRALPTSSG